MTEPVDPVAALESLAPAPGLVVLMCGLAGSGKTTFSQQLEARGFFRLSMDEVVWATAGRFGLDYDAADYPRRLEAARAVTRERLVEAMRARTPTVVDSAFWNRAARDEYKALIEGCGLRVAAGLSPGRGRAAAPPPERTGLPFRRQRPVRGDAGHAGPLHRVVRGARRRGRDGGAGLTSHLVLVLFSLARCVMPFGR